MREDADASALRVLLAFDSFKGSITAREACASAGEGLRGRFGDRVRVTERPLADGGEGSLDLLTHGDANEVVVETVDAIGRPRSAAYLLDETGGTALIEVARAVGLPDVSDVPLRPLEASSRGVGMLIADALRRGAEHLVVFLGGSATTDGGSGILTALGARLLDRDGRDLPVGGGSLEQLASVETSAVPAAAMTARWTFVTDVEAPLTGPTGAARCYAPQKGAGPEEVGRLERGLERAAEILSAADSLALRPGFGAAGGMPLFPAARFGAEVLPGGRFLAEEVGLPATLAEADLVITGEGRFDAQSLDGKVIGTVAQLASEQARPPLVVVVAGDVSAAAGLREAGGLPGIDGAFALAEGPTTLERSQAEAGELLARRVSEIVSVRIGAAR